MANNNRLRPLISDIRALLEAATKTRDFLPTRDDLLLLAEKYGPCDDEFWTLREQAAEVTGIYDDLDKAIVETQDSLDDLLVVGKRMKEKAR